MDSGRGGGLHDVEVPPVIHFSTASSVHSYTEADQHVYIYRPQVYTQGANLGRPGAGVIGACSHAGPGYFERALSRGLPGCLVGARSSHHSADRAPRGGVRSLIPSLIQLRPLGFTWPLSAVPPQVADGNDPRRTRTHRLGKRVGATAKSVQRSSRLARRVRESVSRLFRRRAGRRHAMGSFLTVPPLSTSRVSKPQLADCDGKRPWSA